MRWSDDRVYDTDARVRVFKLHGSVNWFQFACDGRWQTAVLLGSDPNCIRDGDGNILRAQRSGPSFLSGLDKAVAYHRGIYADVHFRFLELLRRCDRMIMSGYGWGDTAINFQLDTWLDGDRMRKLVLLHERPDLLIDRSVILAASYEGWLRAGRLAIIEKWFADASLAELKSLIA